MDYLSIITSINKIAILAFFAILLLIIIEIGMMFKDKKKKAVVKIPDFDTKFGNRVSVQNSKTFNIKPANNKTMIRMLVISTLLLVLFGLLAVFGNYILNQQNQAKKATLTTELPPRIELVDSSGIEIFDSDWKKIQIENITISDGDVLYIGVASIRDSDIDKARIKINKKDWELADETTQFNKINNVFYTQYKIASDESSLKIDAQLHSKEDGWLHE